MEGTTLPSVEQQALMDQFLSMFTQVVNSKDENGKLPQVTIKYAQIAAVPDVISQALQASHNDWQEIAIAEHLGEVAFRSAEWLGFEK